MEEKRVYGRVNVFEIGQQIPCQVTAAGPDRQAQVYDICAGGLAISLDEPLVMNDIVRLAISFPFAALHDEPAKATGRVAYCVKDERTNKFRAGIAYTRQKAKPSLN
jgi:hypothetical protein